MRHCSPKSFMHLNVDTISKYTFFKRKENPKHEMSCMHKYSTHILSLLNLLA